MPDIFTPLYNFIVKPDGSTVPGGSPGGPKLIYFDPLDGSKDANWSHVEGGYTYIPGVGIKITSSPFEMLLLRFYDTIHNVPTLSAYNWAMQVTHVSGTIQAPAGAPGNGFVIFLETDPNSGGPLVAFGDSPGDDKILVRGVSGAQNTAQVSTPSNPPNYLRAYSIFRENPGTQEPNGLTTGLIYAQNWKTDPNSIQESWGEPDFHPEVVAQVIDPTNSFTPRVVPLLGLFGEVGGDNPVFANLYIWNFDPVFLPTSPIPTP